MRAWLVINPQLSQAFTDHVALFIERSKRLGIELKVLPSYTLFTAIEDGQIYIDGLEEKNRPTFVLFWDKNIYLAKALEQAGFRVYNSSHAIATCDDKVLTHLALAKAQLPVPKTLIGPKTFMKSGIVDLQEYQRVGEKLGYPLVMKNAFGSYGRYVYLIHTFAELQQRVQEAIGIPVLFQEYIASSRGTDVRVEVIGGRAVAAMRRISTGDFRSNLAQGGTAHPHVLNTEESELAVSAVRAVGAAFAGVDLLTGFDGKPLVCEINSNAHIINLSRVANTDVALHLLDHLQQVAREVTS